MAHVFEDGSERPVAYVSRKFSDTETRYSQFDREMCGLIHAVNRLHPYLSGRPFHVYMDNKPAVQLLNKRIPDVANPRILRWLVQLGGYSFTVSHREAKRHHNADFLSRCPDPTFPVPESEANIDEEVAGTIHVLRGGGSRDDPLTLSPAVMERYTAQDPVLRQVLKWVREGWPATCPTAEFSAYFNKREELSTVKGCLLWGRGWLCRKG